MFLNIATLAGHKENMSGMGIIGTILPDFGFPDKRMTKILNEVWPGDDFDRGQTYDLYKWYATGIVKGQRAFNVDSSNNPIYGWVKNNSPYSDTKVNHWFAVFKRGIHEGWISGNQVGTSLAPEHEYTKVTSAIKSAASAGADFTKNLKWILFGGTTLIVAFYAMPLISKGVKIKRKFKKRTRYV